MMKIKLWQLYVFIMDILIEFSNASVLHCLYTKSSYDEGLINSRWSLQ